MDCCDRIYTSVFPTPFAGEWKKTEQAGLLTCASPGTVQPSQISPMTGFRLAQPLHAYSGGTVPVLNRILYSPP